MLTWATSSASANPNCTTNPNKGVLCEGDKAWRDGFLVSPEFVKAAKADHDSAALTPAACTLAKALADKVPELQGQRDTAMQQRDASVANADALRILVTGKDGTIVSLQGDNAKLKADLDAKPNWGTVILVGLGGIVVGGAALGVWSIVH